MSYPTDLTDEQWDLLERVFNAPGKRGRKHADDLRSVVDAMLYIAQTGCQWRYLPESFGPWTRVWSQFRRWSRNGTWARALTVLHAAAREADGRTEATPSMVVIDTHLARGASNGGFTFHDRGGPYGRTKGAKRVVAVDVTGLPVGALVVPASTHENRTSELMLEHLTRQGVTERLQLVLVDRGVTAAAARTLGRAHDVGSAGSAGTTSSRCSAQSDTLGASRSPTAASAAHAAWRSRSRTPPPQRPDGSRSPASRPPCDTSRR
jgi:putative transposase